jgi:hypothetical protein
MTDPKPPHLEFSGGAGGTDAHDEDIDQLAHYSEQFGGELAGIAAECHALLANPDLLASAVLDPGGVARFTGELLNALDGPNGLSWLAAGMEGRAVALHTAAASYRAVDQAQAQLIDSVRWVAGGLAAASLPLGLGTLLLSSAAFASPGGGLLAAGLLTEAEKVDWQRLLTDHPGIVDDLVGMGPGFMSGLPGPLLATDVSAGARLLSLLYPDGTAHVDDLGVDEKNIAMTRPPAGFGDLLDGLRYRNGEANGAGQGQIDIRVLTHPDGTRSYIVDVPGTKDWHPEPLQTHAQLNDLSTNLHAMAGDTTAYEHGITEALRRVGASSSDPVMLIGHSQGGIVAAQTAADLAHSGQFNVTHVVTAGSPVGRIDVPASVQMLSLENQHDIVPHLDGAANPDRVNHLTVGFDNQLGTIGDNHGIEQSYLPAAKMLDASTDPSAAAYRASASAFLAGGDSTHMTSHVYQITRS